MTYLDEQIVFGVSISDIESGTYTYTLQRYDFSESIWNDVFVGNTYIDSSQTQCTLDLSDIVRNYKWNPTLVQTSGEVLTEGGLQMINDFRVRLIVDDEYLYSNDIYVMMAYRYPNKKSRMNINDIDMTSTTFKLHNLLQGYDSYTNQTELVPKIPFVRTDNYRFGFVGEVTRADGGSLTPVMLTGEYPDKEDDSYMLESNVGKGTMIYHDTLNSIYSHLIGVEEGFVPTRLYVNGNPFADVMKECPRQYIHIEEKTYVLLEHPFDFGIYADEIKNRGNVYMESDNAEVLIVHTEDAFNDVIVYLYDKNGEPYDSFSIALDYNGHKEYQFRGDSDFAFIRIFYGMEGGSEASWRDFIPTNSVIGDFEHNTNTFKISMDVDTREDYIMNITNIDISGIVMETRTDNSNVSKSRYYLMWQDRLGGFQSQPFDGKYKFSNKFTTNKIQSYQGVTRNVYWQDNAQWTINTGWLSEELYPYYESIYVSPFLLLYDVEEDEQYSVLITDTDYNEKTWSSEKKLFNLTINVEQAHKQTILN